MQMKHNPRSVGADPAPGGYYLIVADRRGLAKQHHGQSLPDNGARRYRRRHPHWLQGKDDACPKLP